MFLKFWNKNGFKLQKLETFLLSFACFSFFLYNLTNKASKLEVAGSNLMENISRSLFLSFSVSVRFSFPLFLVLVFISHSLNSFVDAAIQLLLSGVISSSITLINVEF